MRANNSLINLYLVESFKVKKKFMNEAEKGWIFDKKDHLK